MHLNSNIKRTIRYFYLDHWNKISLEMTCEDVYFVMLNNIDMIANTKDRSEAEKIFEDMKK